MVNNSAEAKKITTVKKTAPVEKTALVGKTAPVKKTGPVGKTAPVKKTGPHLRPVDFFVVLLCLSGAVASFNLFRLDLFRTINSQNQKPVGTVTIRNNTVQRRLRDRVIWDRLFVGSQIYEGDTLRIAESSSMGFKRDDIEIEYINYQIRRIPPLAPDGTLQIDGNVIVTIGAGSGSVILNGSRVEAGPGTVIKAESGESGTKLQVLEGDKIRIIKDGETWERGAGETVGWDADGRERIEPGVVVTQPRPNAHYIKTTTDPMNIGFAWNKKDIESGQALRLEIAADRNFTRIVYASDTIDDIRQAALDDGSWYWRLSYGGAVLAGEHFTITETAAPALIYPIMDSTVRYENVLPELCFQWSETEEASSYLLEVCSAPDFSSPQISARVGGASSLHSDLGPGTWYWRVRPFFSSANLGGNVSSSVASFTIEHGEEDKLILPEPEIVEIPPEPSPQPPAPPPPLAAPGNLRPTRGYRVGIEQLRAGRRIDFRWSAVPGANNYIFTLYRQNAAGRRQIIRRELGNRTSLTLNDLTMLDRGTFIWQVEASERRSGSILRRSRPAENLLVLDFPLPSAPTVQIEEVPQEAETPHED